MRISEFKSAKAEARFRAAYERALGELWPGPRTALDVPTAFGTTRVYRAGPRGSRSGDHPGHPDSVAAIVLLPGSGGNALMWHDYIGELSRHHTVFAVDTVGEPGASVQTAPIADGVDGAAWLDELLAGLDVSAAHVVGCSYGGWLALDHALHRPGRTAALTLLDPAGFQPIGARFYRWLIVGGLASLAPRRLRPRLARLVRNSAILDTELMRLARASTGFRRALPAPPVFTDEELRRLDPAVPTLFLLGEHSALHNSHEVAARIGALAPAARVETVAGTSHSLATDVPALAVDRILGNTHAERHP